MLIRHSAWSLIATLKNGYICKRRSVKHPKTNIVMRLLDVLWDEGYISGYRLCGTEGKIKIFLKYHKRKPAVAKISSISKPGRRVYFSLKQLWKIKSTNCLIILSTSKGMKSMEACRKEGLGGEPLLIVF